MARALKRKDLINTRLASTYGGWMYCTSCNKNIGYLCYVTYDKVNLEYECNCGSKGNAMIEFEDSIEGLSTNQKLITIKNRFCCAKDESPLITMLSKNVKNYKFEITCKACGKIYEERGEEK